MYGLHVLVGITQSIGMVVFTLFYFMVMLFKTLQLMRDRNFVNSLLKLEGGKIVPTIHVDFET